MDGYFFSFLCLLFFNLVLRRLCDSNNVVIGFSFSLLYCREVLSRSSQVRLEAAVVDFAAKIQHVHIGYASYAHDR